MKYCYIPENFNLNTHIGEYPVDHFGKFNPDHVFYILDKISKIPVFNKKANIINGFIPLSSTALQDKIPNYSQYLTYLINSKVIECDNHYIKEEKCKGYKFTSKYQTKVTRVECNMKRTVDKFKLEMKKLKVHKDYKHLLKWFNDDLQLDYRLAKDFIETDWERKLWFPNLKDKKLNKVGKEEIKDPYNQYNCNLIALNYLREKNFFYTVDTKGWRLHTNLTNISGTLRNCLTYKGDTLVSIDIKNSQPYLCTLLLQPSFWEDSLKKQEKFSINHFKRLKSSIFNNFKQYQSFIRLLKSPETQNSTAFQEFIFQARNGTIYEYMEEKLKEKGLHHHIHSRKDLKQMMFLVLFTDNKFRNQERALPKELFIKIFPEVYEVLKVIKKHGNELLPLLLQSIESDLIIKKATKRIAEINPNAPLYTVHDSIVTTVENQLLAFTILEQTLTEFVGHKPSLSVDLWSPSNLEYSDKVSYLADLKAA